MTRDTAFSLYGVIVQLEKDEAALSFILLELLLLYVATQLTRFVLPLITPRIKLHPERRQQQLYTMIPVLILKSAVMVLLFKTIEWSWLCGLAVETRCQAQVQDTIKGTLEVEYQFQVWFFMAISYVFEVLHRPCSSELIAHHILLQALNFYFWFYAKSRLFTLESPLQGDSVLGQAAIVVTAYTRTGHVLVVEFFMLMVVLGPGLTDGLSDLTFIFYYTAPPKSNLSQIALQITSWGAAMARGVQWVLLAGYIVSHWQLFLLLLGTLEKIAFGIAIPLWFWTEIDEIRKIRGMSQKYGRMQNEERPPTDDKTSNKMTEST